MTGPATRLGGSRGVAPRRWLARRTLRGRLIAGLVTLLALACAAVGIVTYVVLHSTLQTQLDSQLHASGGSYAGCMEEATAHHGPAPGAPQSCNTLPGQATGTFG